MTDLCEFQFDEFDFFGCFGLTVFVSVYMEYSLCCFNLILVPLFWLGLTGVGFVWWDY